MQEVVGIIGLGDNRVEGAEGNWPEYNDVVEVSFDVVRGWPVK